MECVLSPSSISDQLILRDRDMALRPATKSDEPFLAFLDVQERRSAYAGLGVSKALLEKLSASHLRAQAEAYLAQYRRAENLMVLRHGEAIGRFWIAMEGNAGSRSLRLIDLVLREEVRGQGIGCDILCSLVDSARAMRLARVTLSVFAGNVGAIRLCKKIGFRMRGGGADETECLSMVYPLA